MFGDLNNLFSNNFDTSIGFKRDGSSYLQIAQELNLNPTDIIFLSDISEELDAAKMVGFNTAQLVRLDDVQYMGHQQVKKFHDIKF